MHAKDHAEQVLLDSLLRSKGDEVYVSPWEIEQMERELKDVYNRILDKWLLPGFTEDDLLSFMHLKTHQILRRQVYDYNRKPNSLFYRSFDNMMKDLAKSMQRASKNGMDHDALEMVSYFEFSSMESSLSSRIDR
jgi:hypothetical protein